MEAYGAVGVTILLSIVLCAITLLIAHTLGPKRHGPVKDSPYESGVPVIGGARSRFHVRFYIVALLFLLFDVEVLLIIPWALTFHNAAVHGARVAVEVGDPVGKGFLLIGMAVFFGLLVLGLLYEWKKGAFRWD